MNSSKNKIKPKNVKKTISHEPDYILFILASLLMIIGMIFSYSLSVYTVEYWNYDQFHFFIRQTSVGIFSILLMWYMAHKQPQKLVNNVGWFLFIAFFIVMAIMPFLPSSLVSASGGANRWIKLPGISISPVEFFKIGFIYFLAWSFHRKVIVQPKKMTIKDEFLLLAPYFLAFLLVVFIVAFLQKDLGQVVLLGLILVALMIFANRSYKIFLILGTGAVVGVVGLIIAAPHRIIRIQSWWSMVQDGVLSIMPNSIANALRIKDFPEPYQVGHSLNAIHNGGWFGQGISQGNLKLGFLSEVHTDFVLAGITEEIGLLGLVGIISILLLIIWRIFRISRRTNNALYHLFTLGIGLMIVVAFLINSYGISGMIPIKGIAVPFLSYGGSSLLSVAIAIGLVLSISTQIQKDEIK